MNEDIRDFFQIKSPLDSPAWVLGDLRRSGISNRTIEDMQIISAPDNADKRKSGTELLKQILGFSKLANQAITRLSSFYILPYPQNNGFLRVKLQIPIEKAKYLSPKRNHVNISAELYYLEKDQHLLNNPKYTLIITEGEKKAAKLSQEIPENMKMVAVGIPGVTVWKNCLEGKGLRLAGKEILLAFDQDFQKNSDVEQQLLSLFLYLYKKKANVAILTWEKGNGIDDYFVEKEREGEKAQEILTTILEQKKENIFALINNNYLGLLDAVVSNYYSLAECEALFEKFKLAEKYEITSAKFSALVRKKYKKKDPLPAWIVINDKSGKKSVITGIAANVYFEKQNGNLIYSQETFWDYNQGVWGAINDRDVKANMQAMIVAEDESLSRKSTIEDIFYQVCNLSLQKSDFEFNTHPWLLNFKNGVLDTQTSEILEHKKEYYQTNQFPFEYDPTAECPLWADFLVGLQFQKDTYWKLQEWTGYCLVPVIKIHKCLYFKGEGDNGKSVFLETIAEMLKNVSHMEMSELFDHFKIADLRGKLANICTDIETSKVFDARFKKIVSGEKQAAEQKHHDPFEFRPFAKILFSANDYIPTKDRSFAFFKRFDILEFTRIFTKEEQDPDLKEKLYEELAGIFNWSYIGLKRLKKNNWKMTESEAMMETHQEFRLASNPLQQFIEERCRLEINATIETSQFRNKYKDWCEEKGYETLAENRLGREMKRLGFPNARYRSSGSRVYKYKGIEIIEVRTGFL